jgi:acetyltransferase-like isoleucine patch superfamily enzyme
MRGAAAGVGAAALGQSGAHFARRAEAGRGVIRLIAGFGRGQLLRVRGGHVGRRVRLGRSVRVDRPWAVTVGERAEIEADVWFKVVSDEAKVEVGAYTFIGRGTEIDSSEAVSIGAHVLIAPGVFITDHSHVIEGREHIDGQGCIAASVVIGDGAWLGAHCVVLPGVHVGRGAVVGAGAVVTSDVPDWAIVAGVPARVRRHRVERSF